MNKTYFQDVFGAIYFLETFYRNIAIIYSSKKYLE